MKISKTLLIFVLFFTSNAFAGSKCPELYPMGQVIVVPNTIELCNLEYVAVYNPIMRANIFSSERYKINSRTNIGVSFKADKRISADQRATLADYAGKESSIYDRGHMAPAGDMSTNESQRESNLLTNITPQHSKLNRGSWKKLESTIRNTTNNNIHILTGAIYAKEYATIGANKIPVPSEYFKCAWYLNSSTIVKCYKAKNTETAIVEETSLNYINAQINYIIK